MGYEKLLPLIDVS